MIISNMKEKLKFFHACFRADTTTTAYTYKAGRTDGRSDRETGGSILICHPSEA
jgi:hypothetical protein